MPSRTGFCALHLLVSGRCNLACEYCYQGPRKIPPRMPWSVARRALDVLLEEGTPPLTVEFGGGEPLLEFGLLTRCVGYVKARRRGAVRLRVTTNGTLLTPQVVDLLVENDVHLRISFDGPSAQDHRGKGTAGGLEAALAMVRDAHPDYLEDRVQIQTVLMRETLPGWSETSRHLVASGAGALTFSPVIGDARPLDAACARLLREQALAVAEVSEEHWRRTGRIPVRFLREATSGGANTRLEGPACSAAWGAALCVSTDGQVWTCPMFVPGLQSLTPMAAEASAALSLGRVGEPGLISRIERLRLAAAVFPFFSGRGSLHSDFGRCAECEVRAGCVFCPASISHSLGNDDPARVPPFHCALSRAKAEARRRFQRTLEREGGTGPLGQMERALRCLLEAVEEDVNRSGAPASGADR
jgi:sulfatase maturation enzyme AslB (radical SAM superfamily)